MTVFPGQLGAPPRGPPGIARQARHPEPGHVHRVPRVRRLKLTGTIVKSRATRYFTLNVKSKDRLQLEDWFDSMIVSRRASGWDRGNQPGEEPIPFPTGAEARRRRRRRDPPRTPRRPDRPPTSRSPPRRADPTAAQDGGLRGPPANETARRTTSGFLPWTPTTSTPRTWTMVRTRVTRERRMTTSGRRKPPPSLGLVANRPRRRYDFRGRFRPRGGGGGRGGGRCFGARARRRPWRRSPRRCPRRNEEGARGRPRRARGRRRRSRSARRWWPSATTTTRRPRRREAVAISDDDGTSRRAGRPAARGRTDQPSRGSRPRRRRRRRRRRERGGGSRARRKTSAGVPAASPPRSSCSTSTATPSLRRTRRWKRMTIAILRCERYRSDQCRRPSRAAEGWVVFLLAVVSNIVVPPFEVQADKGRGRYERLCQVSIISACPFPGG